MTDVSQETRLEGRYVLPASCAQRRLWVLDVMEPESAAANVEHRGLRMRGPLDTAALTGALNRLIARHEILRTALIAVDGEPVQVIEPAATLSLPRVDLAGRPGDLDRAVREQAARPLTLAQAPLLRCVLYRLGPDDHLLLASFHHAIWDQWSGGVFLRELRACYQAELAGGDPGLPELPVQYADFAAWQRDWLDSPDERAQIDYWRDRLAGLPALDLPTDRPRPRLQTFRGAIRTARLPAGLMAGLEETGRRHSASAFMTALAAFLVLLRGYSGQDDVAVGSPVAGRTRPELEPLIGCFINNLVLRADLSGDPDVATLLGRVRQLCLDAYGHADVPFERLVERLRPERDLSRNPLFSVMFVFAGVPIEPAAMSGVRIEPSRVDAGTAKFDLFVSVLPARDGAEVSIEYNTDLFDDATIGRMIGHYLTLLEQVTGDPARPLSALRMLSAEEDRQLAAWGHGPEREIPVLDLPVIRPGDPNRAAVRCGGATQTYAELDRRAGEFARRLAALGAAPGGRVGLLAERTVDLPALLIGIWRTGAAYVPLDPGWPAERLEYVVADAGLTVVATTESLAGRLPDGCVIMLADHERPETPCQQAPRPEPPDPGAAAYVMYTSGSTGRPKGVEVTHRSVANFLAAMAEEVGTGPDDVVAAVTTVAFDISVLELFLPLLTGATVEIFDRETVADGRLLARRLDECRVSVVQGTPTLFGLLRGAGWRPGPQLRVLAGAERVPASLARWLAGAGAPVWHVYGPTETTVWSAVHRVTGDEGWLPLGRALANTELVVAGPAGERVPVGVAGELWIGGSGVASGYWGRPELTAERFTDRPDAPGPRFYRTGDVVRWRGDGGLEFVGRADFQVKVRGFRVELGEVEAALAAQPGVGQAVVLAREDEPGQPRLVGYVTAAPGGTPDEATVLAGARRVLAEYMVPSRLVVLEQFPLTANQSKIDRSALPAPDQSRAVAGEYVAPRSAAERELAQIWARVLGVDQVGATDNFFALGGHSLLAARALEAVRTRWGLDIPLRTLFTEPTLAGFAAALTETAAVPGDKPATAGPPVQPVERVVQADGPLAGRLVLPASPGQRRLWFLHQLDPGSARSYLLTGGLRLRGPLDETALRRALGDVVGRHETLRTGLEAVGGQPMQIVSPSVADGLITVDLSAAPDRDAALDELIDGQLAGPVSLAGPSLLRVVLARLDEADHALLVMLHHAVGDRLSLEVLVGEIAARYAAHQAGDAPALAPLPVQYADFAAWQRARTDGGGEAAGLDYWRGKLAGLPVLDLPADRPRPASQSYRGATRSATVSGAAMRGCRQTAASSDATLFMVGLAAFWVVLARYSGQDDFGVGTPVAGRSRAELEGLVGFFVNNLVLRADVSGDPTVGGLVGRARQVCLEAFGHAQVPFERLVEELRPQRDLARTPLFSTMFVYNHLPTPVPRLPGLAATPLRVAPPAAKYDLTVTLFPDDAGDGYRLSAEYSTDLFDPDTVDRLLGHLAMLLAEFGADPDRRLSELPALPAAERDLVLGDWARTQDQPAGVLPDLFAAQAAARPAAAAARCGDEVVSYAELNTRADRLAAVLAAQGGARLGQRVGICVRRGLALPAAILAVLKTGAAYVPLDPEWPAERMSYVLADCGAALLVSDVPGADQAARCPVVRPQAGQDAGDEGDGGQAPDWRGPDVATSPDDVAYVIYTSGSTGQPKGTLVTHANVSRLVSGLARRLDLTGDDTWSMTHSAAFDVSVCEMWGAWLTGAQVAVIDYLTTREPDALAAELHRSGVTVLSQTPTAFGQLAAADAGRADRLTGLRYVLFAGERLEVGRLAGWVDRYGDTRPELINLYGITETTVHLTVHRVTRDDLARPWRSNVGRPLPDTALYLLRWRDGQGAPVPVGAIGEICVAGPGVARGYLGRPELTAQRFTGYRGQRVYRSGDLARWLPTGDLDVLGRADGQVKIRGFRVEPGEVEAALRHDPRVGEAAVVARPGAAGELALVAYVVPHGPPPPVGELLAALRQTLPGYLVPSHLLMVGRLPLTANGKLDTAALPQPDGERPDVAGYVPPRTEAERRMAAIWARVLRVERVGVHDSFFDLGGHSLLATELLTQVRQEWGTAVPLRTLFGAPTVSRLTEALPTAAAAAAAPVPAVAARPRLPGSHGACQFPASFGQQRLWFLHQLDPASAGAYVLAGAFRLRGGLDTAALRRALAWLTARHEVLRTGLEAAGGEPVQVVWPDAEPRWRADDLPAGPDRDEALAQWLASRIGEPFDLAEPPLMRAALARTGADDHVLLITLHHAIGDRLSVEILVRELAACYAACAGGAEPGLGQLPVQYADFAAWQQDWLGTEPEQDQVAYWREQLAGLPVLDLPADRPRPAVQTYHGATRTARLPAGLMADLERLAARHDATLFMTLLAGFTIMLSRYTGLDDIPVGSPVSGRPRPELEPLIGYLTNNLVLRADLSGDPDFAGLLGRVRQMCLDAYAHAEVPFERLVEQLRPERDLSRSPLFSVMFVQTHLENPVPELPGLAVSAEPLPAESAKFDLTVALAPAGRDGGYQVLAEYNSDLLDAATADRMLAHYQMVLAAVAAEPDLALSGLPELPAAEVDRLREWGHGPGQPVPDTTVPGLLAPAFGAFAGRVAVADGSSSLTYAELDTRASQLARHLREMGAGPGSRVALFLDRCADLEVAVLGVLRSGAAYVPLDTDFPAERIEYILGDCQAPVILTREHLAGRLPAGPAAVFRLDADWSQAARQPGIAPPATAVAEDIAYVIYTSGSTGRPKGVELPHRAVVNFLTAMAGEPGLPDGAVVAAASAVSCDMPVLEEYLTLLAGGRIEMISRAEVIDGRVLAGRLAESGVSVIQGTPTLFGLLRGAGWRPPAGLRVLVGAERVPAGLAGWLADAGASVWHVYGPTETTVWSTAYRVTGGESWLPLGRAVANTELLVAGPSGGRAPVGVAGELWIGGTGLAAGYAGRPELTADRFVWREGMRFYRTGDVVRWRGDGALEFIGRADFQVKVRGFRVELGEVEAALAAQPGVAEAAVVVREDVPGQPRLVGYVTADPGRAGPDEATVLAGARRVLADYMVPARVVVLERFPLTANRNKIDRSALPAPDRTRAEPGEFVAPRSAAERELAQIWAQVLGVDQVGATDNFFTLGGHSLLATRMINRVRAAFGADVQVRAVFERPTVEALAEVLPVTTEQLTAPIPAQARMKIPDGRFAGRFVLPASPGQRRLWFLHQLDPGSAAAYIIGAPVRLTGPLDTATLQRAVDTVTARHETLRTAFGSIDSEPVQVITPELRIPLDVHDLRAAADNEGELTGLIRRTLTTPFDLATAPLLRLALAVTGDDEHVLTIAFHHAIGDEASTQVFVRELAACYRGYAAGTEPELAELPLQYGDFAAWYAGWLERPEAAAQLDYWRGQLAGLPVLDLPADHPRPPVQTYRGARRSADLPEALAVDLAGLAADNGATLFMVGLAAFWVVLARYSGQDDFGVGTPVAGRSRAELEGLVGFFVNNLVLRADVSGDPSVADLVGRARQVCLEAFGHAQVPFERLVEDLRPERDLARTPLVQAGFLLAEMVSEREHRGTGLTVTARDYDPGTAKVDLALSLIPEPGGLRVLAEYNTDLYDPDTIDRLLAHYRMLLGEFAAAPERRLSELPALPTDEAAAVAVWGQGPAEALPAGCFPDLFEEQAAAHPERTAVICGDQRPGYGELNAKASQLARHLQELGVGPDVLVAIVAERSVTMVLAVLAVLKAGGGYLPVDPAYPAERVELMLRDSGCPVILTSAGLADTLPATAARIVRVDEDWAEIARQPDTNPARETGHDHLAYAIYTSGSTGTPKGVLVTHRSLVNLHLTRVLGHFHDGSRFLQFAPFSFDVSVWELTMALLGGHVLVVPSPPDLAGPAEVAGLIGREQVTVTFLPPSLLAYLPPQSIPSIELLGSGGEDCPAEVAERWAGQARFLIGYGPTETTVYATVTGEITAGGHPPIGWPVHNTHVTVLGRDGRPVPIGVPGELYIGGAGLARGYLGRPDETAERFIDDADGRRYRTGDLVRYRPDGNLEFVGRLDDQVKIRGFRIELGEVESALRAHPGVAAATVAVRETGSGDRRLIGYVVPAADQPGEDLGQAVREFAGRRLPGYMNPAVVLTVPEIPVGPSGKVDRDALPEPAGQGGGPEPATPTERTVAGLFASALGVAGVSATDSFFELGGHSLLAARLAEAASQELGVDLPVREVFERPTVAALAARLDELASAQPGQAAQPTSADAQAGQAAEPGQATKSAPADAQSAASGQPTAAAQPAPADAQSAPAGPAPQAPAPPAPAPAPATAADEAEAELRRDIQLDPELRPNGPVPWPATPGAVVVTGATGLVGGHIVRQLLATTSAVINCIVRAADDSQAAERLAARLPGADLSRIRAIAGDLARPDAGLSLTRFAELAEQADEVYHVAADLNPMLGYRSVRGTNVGGFRAMLRLAASGRAVPLHHVSTLSVFARVVPGEPLPQTLREDMLPARPPTMGSGYEQSKWVIEQLAALARERGLPVCVYRPGRVAGDSQTGQWREDDLLAQVIIACGQLGLVPDAGLATEIIPADVLAQMITTLARNPAAAGLTFHCTGPAKVPFTRLADALTARGREARLVSAAQWNAALDEPDGKLPPALPMMLRRMGDGWREPHIDTTNTTRLLDGRLRAPDMDTDLLGRYVDNLL